MCVLAIKLFHIFGLLAVPSDLCTVNARLDPANRCRHFKALYLVVHKS